MARLILASASPRRRDLLTHIGFEFEIVPADVDESVPDGERDVATIARELARRKAAAIAPDYPDDIVLAADTIVVDGEELLAKPESAEDAWRMLRQLRGRRHEVITGIAVASGDDIRLDHVSTGVLMRDYSDEEIEASIARGAPFDKAGGYAIQDPVFNPVERFDGCYCNVVGLPLVASVKLLIEAGFSHKPPVKRFPARCGPCLQAAGPW